MNFDAIAQAAIKVLLVLAALVVLYAIWHFVVRPLLTRRRKWQGELDAPRYAPQTQYGNEQMNVFLQQAIETAVHRNPHCRIVFASPMTKNPGVLLDDAPQGTSKGDIVSEDTMVNVWKFDASGGR